MAIKLTCAVEPGAADQRGSAEAFKWIGLPMRAKEFKTERGNPAERRTTLYFPPKTIFNYTFISTEENTQQELLLRYFPLLKFVH